MLKEVKHLYKVLQSALYFWFILHSVVYNEWKTFDKIGGHIKLCMVDIVTHFS